MCGRYANHIHALKNWEALLGEWPKALPTGFNIAPSQDAPVFTRDGVRLMRWGLVPCWSKESKTKYATINARAEKLTASPAYRGAWRQGQRCLVPALGYYEWCTVGAGGKQPHFIYRDDAQPLMFAGVWDQWQGTDENAAAPFASFTIITTNAVGSIANIHPRMPLMLEPEQGKDWLTAPPRDCDIVLTQKPQSEPQSKLSSYPVSTRVNSPSNQGAELIERLG